MELQDVSDEALWEEINKRKGAQEIIKEPEMSVSVYYRSPNKKLHQVDVQCDTIKEAEQAVMAQLHADKEKFLKPLLCLIKKPELKPEAA